MAVMESKEHALEAQELRAIYCDALLAAAERDEKIVVLNCDMSTSMGTNPFVKRFPERSFNMGIQEANACGTAAGLSLIGFKPFLHTFSAFITRRIYDQIFLSCAYAGLNIKLVGGDAGISTASNGGTHMPFEDVGLLRLVPGVTIVEPADGAAMRALLPQIAALYGVSYLRMPRRKAMRIYEPGTDFTIGKANILREGRDVSIIASGMLVYEALLAADMLLKQGIHACVVDMFTIKPLDEACVLACARETGAIVTAENHNYMNGLGSAVAETLVENYPVPMERIGVREQFGEVGTVEYLMERFELSAPFIYKKAIECVARKR